MKAIEDENMAIILDMLSEAKTLVLNANVREVYVTNGMYGNIKEVGVITDIGSVVVKTSIDYRL